MKDYSLKSEQNDHFEINHPKDGTFRVAKQKLDARTLKKIRGLPKAMAEGGEVGGDRADMPASPVGADYAPMTSMNTLPPPTDGVPDWAKQEGAQYLGYQSPGTQTSGIPMLPTEAAPAAPVAETTSNPNTLPVGGEKTQTTSAVQEPMVPDYTSGLDKAFAGEAKGIKETQAAQQQFAADSTKFYQDYIKRLNEAAATRDQSLAKNQIEHDQITQQIKDQKIDPNRIWANTSTGNTILASIGVLLSGIGSGLTGGPNLALESINKAVDRDIEAQRMELGKKETLLSENLRKYGDINRAYEATSMQLHSVVGAQIQVAASKSSSAQAKANATTALAQLDLQRSNLSFQLAQAQGQTQLGRALGEGKFAGTPINPEDPRMAPFRDRLVRTGQGGYVLAKTKDSAKEVQQSLTSLDKIDAQLDNILDLQKKVGRTAPGTDANAVAKSAQHSLILEMGQLHDVKRLNDNELEMYKDLVPDPGAWRQDRATAQIMQLKKLVREKKNAEFQNNVEGFSPGAAGTRTSPVKPVLTGG